jgi:isopentenyl-diphosphate Delta-isomerase
MKSVEAAAHRRLMEEMGFDTELEFVTSFIYKAELDNGLTEHEFDHVFIGKYDEVPTLNSDEVADWKFIPLHILEKDLELNPTNYTVWFRIIFSKVKAHLLNQPFMK